MESESVNGNELTEDILRKREKKKALLEKREVNRIDEIQQRKNNNVERQTKIEAEDHFALHFKQECEAIQLKLEKNVLNKADRIAVAEYLQELSNSSESLLKFMNDSTVFLRPFQLEQAQKTMNQILLDISNKKLELIPKKKFAFKSKKKTEPSATKKPVIDNSKLLTKKHDFSANECGISQKSDETIIMGSEEISQRDVSLSKIKNSRLELPGCPGTVHLDNIENCVILCGPVSGSVFVDNCTGSKIVTGCQQLRVHNTTNTDFYLHVTSRAIIEDTSKVRFSPYNWSYEKLDEDFVKSGLNQQTNNWNKVDDFNWLAMDTKSPNWSVLPEAERKTDW